MDGSGEHYAYWNKTEKYKYLLYVIIYFWTLEKKTVKSLVI